MHDVKHYTAYMGVMFAEVFLLNLIWVPIICCLYALSYQSCKDYTCKNLIIFIL